MQLVAIQPDIPPKRNGFTTSKTVFWLSPICIQIINNYLNIHSNLILITNHSLISTTLTWYIFLRTGRNPSSQFNLVIIIIVFLVILLIYLRRSLLDMSLRFNPRNICLRSFLGWNRNLTKGYIIIFDRITSMIFP